MLRIVSIATATILAISFPQAAQSAPKRAVEIYGGLITVVPPEGWLSIPPDLLEELSMRTAVETVGRSVEVYQDGFRPRNPGADLWLPNILVQIRESGRIPYGRFLHLPTLDELRTASARTYPEGIPPLIMGVAVEGVAFDRERMIIHLEHALDLKFKGRVRVLTAALLTERGLVAFHYLDREMRIDDGRRVFGEFIDSVQPSDEIAYRPRISDRWPGLPFFAAAAVAAVALVLYVLRRRSTQ